MQQPPEPPPQYAAYPRESRAVYGSAEQLRALYKGYSGLTLVFVLNILLSLLIQALFMNAGGGEDALLIWLIGSAVIGVFVALATYRCNKSIAYGANWHPSMAILASTLMGLNSALCCGIIGYVVLQQLATNEMKKYGLKSRFFGGIRKREVEQIAVELETLQRGYGDYSFPPQV